MLAGQNIMILSYSFNEAIPYYIKEESFHIRVQQAFHPPSPIFLKFIPYVYNTKTRKIVEF